jgi:FtsP/CotA-like multicopper oxidase with cupredoxin domain
VKLLRPIVSVAVLLTALPVSLRADPDAVRPPEGSVLKLSVLGTGSQVYQCQSASDQPGHFEWKFQGPEAQLTDATGKVVGKHYAGPTWQWSDGSTVVGEVKARYAGPDPSAIPWLLLTAKSTTGRGALGNVQSIVRSNTTGGAVPAANCGAANVNQIVHVPYTANYSFYTGKQ